MNKLTRTYRFLKRLPAALSEINGNVRLLQDQLQSTTTKLEATHDHTNKSLDSFSGDLENIKQQQADMLHTISKTKAGGVKLKPTAASADGGLQADNHELDGYYLAF
jgi:hypothetical protein